MTFYLEKYSGGAIGAAGIKKQNPLEGLFSDSFGLLLVLFLESRFGAELAVQDPFAQAQGFRRDFQ